MIQVLLASYRGEAYLQEQINSIQKQNGVDVALLISDDFDAKKTRGFLSSESLKQSSLSLFVVDGPKKGVNANFAHLIKEAVLSDGDYFAFSDQDDVWHEDKLRVAQQQLASFGKVDRPSIYMGRTMVCDELLNPLFLSKGMPRAASFQNALLESIAGGNTMVFNQATLALLKKITVPVHHDWLTYMVVTASGGTVIFDDEPYVLYRQHGGNVIGANNGFAQKLYRLKKLLSNEFRGWAGDNIKALLPILDDMTAENRRVYEGFVRLHNMRGWHRCFSRLALFQKIGLYRQRRLEHYGFMLAAFLGKI